MNKRGLSWLRENNIEYESINGNIIHNSSEMIELALLFIKPLKITENIARLYNKKTSYLPWYN